VPLWEEIWDNLIAYGITAAIAGLVLAPTFFFWRSRRVWPLQRLRKGFWTGGQVWIAFFIFLFVPSMAGDFLDQLGFFQVPALFEKIPSPIRQEIWAAPLATLLTLAVLIWILFISSRTRPSHLGLTLARWPQNVFLGYCGFLVVTPLLLGLYFLILLLIPRDMHPFEELGKEPLTVVEWGLLFFRASIAAALMEEVIFRGVLQGWLRRASMIGHVTLIFITLFLGFTAFLTSIFGNTEGMVKFMNALNGDGGPVPPLKDPNAGPLIFVLILALGYGFILFRWWSPILAQKTRLPLPEEKTNYIPVLEKIQETGFSATELPSPKSDADQLPDVRIQNWRQWEKKNACMAIYGSAMLFAAFHSLVWPSPIPLFLIGIVLGFLAFRTQSLLPGIILHGLFNTVACFVLWLGRNG
jgi:membrane protease YdiL (CAAX protease family)